MNASHHNVCRNAPKYETINAAKAWPAAADKGPLKERGNVSRMSLPQITTWNCDLEWFAPTSDSKKTVDSVNLICDRHPTVIEVEARRRIKKCQFLCSEPSDS